MTETKKLPFNIKNFKISPVEMEKIYDHIRTAAHIIGIVAPLDWKDREYATRQIWDAITALNAIKKQGEMK